MVYNAHRELVDEICPPPTDEWRSLVRGPLVAWARVPHLRLGGRQARSRPASSHPPPFAVGGRETGHVEGPWTATPPPGPRRASGGRARRARPLGTVIPVPSIALGSDTKRKVAEGRMRAASGRWVTRGRDRVRRLGLATAPACLSTVVRRLPRLRCSPPTPSTPCWRSSCGGSPPPPSRQCPPGSQAQRRGIPGLPQSHPPRRVVQPLHLWLYVRRGKAARGDSDPGVGRVRLGGPRSAASCGERLLSRWPAACRCATASKMSSPCRSSPAVQSMDPLRSTTRSRFMALMMLVPVYLEPALLSRAPLHPLAAALQGVHSLPAHRRRRPWALVQASRCVPVGRVHVLRSSHCSDSCRQPPSTPSSARGGGSRPRAQVSAGFRESRSVDHGRDQQ